MTSDSRALLNRLPGCARLGADALDALGRATRHERFPAGARLVTEGEPAPDWYCVVESGAVQISRLDLDGDEILEYLAGGDVLDPGMPGSPAAWSASAVEEARCLLVPQSAVTECCITLGVESTGGYRGELALFVRRARDLIKGPPATCGRSTSVAEAARLMSRRGVGSVIVVGEGGEPLGIITDRDLRTRVLAPGIDPTTRADAIMSSPIVSLEPERLAFDAMLEMTRRDVHHLAVVGHGRLLGVISSHDLLWLQGAHPLAVTREVEAASTVEVLALVASRLPAVVRWLAGGGAGPFDIGRIVAELNDRLIRRALSLVESALAADGHSRAPVRYSWFTAGSEGRREQTLKTDQDNGLVYEDPPPELREAATSHFARLAKTMGDTLVQIGFPPCEGGFMASNPRWCQPLSVWREYFGSWMETPHPQPLLYAALYFDLRPVAGEEAPALTLWEWVCERAPSESLFHRYMARAAVEHQPPLGFFGGFVVERSGAHEGKLDIKARGIFPVTQAMRVHALALGLRETNTVDRLRGTGARGAITDDMVRELSEAFEVICRLRLSHQLACLDAGLPPDNFIAPATLSRSDRLLLREAFRTIGLLQRGLEERFMTASLV